MSLALPFPRSPILPAKPRLCPPLVTSHTPHKSTGGQTCSAQPVVPDSQDSATLAEGETKRLDPLTVSALGPDLAGLDRGPRLTLSLSLGNSPSQASRPAGPPASPVGPSPTPIHPETAAAQTVLNTLFIMSLPDCGLPAAPRGPWEKSANLFPQNS